MMHRISRDEAWSERSVPRRWLRVVVAGVGLVILGAGPVGSTPFDRYQVILDREPFGRSQPAPPARDPAPEPSMSSAFDGLRLSAMIRNEQTGGVRVGILNARQGESYFLGVGEKESDIFLVAAEYEKERALVRLGSEEAWLRLDDAGQAPRTAAAGSSASPRQAGRSARADRSSGRSRRPAPQRVSIRSLRDEETTELLASLDADQRQEFYEDLQMDLIRAGGELGPPLPIPLTPEMDAQLVAEGLLPPHEDE